MKVSRITEPKFEALKVLADDISSCGAALEFSTEIISLHMKITKSKQLIKMELINNAVVPVTRLMYTMGVEQFKKILYEDFRKMVNGLAESII